MCGRFVPDWTLEEAVDAALALNLRSPESDGG